MLQTIESDDRNLITNKEEFILFNNNEISRIEENLSHVYEEPQPDTKKDLQNLLRIINKFDK